MREKCHFLIFVGQRGGKSLLRHHIIIASEIKYPELVCMSQEGVMVSPIIFADENLPTFTYTSRGD
jgi:hypothetical protein